MLVVWKRVNQQIQFVDLSRFDETEQASRLEKLRKECSTRFAHLIRLALGFPSFASGEANIACCGRFITCSSMVGRLQL